MREQHGILAELVLEPSDGQGRNGRDHRLAVTPRCSTPGRHARPRPLTASDVHRAVDYRPITRYDLAGGYVNIDALRREQP